MPEMVQARRWDCNAEGWDILLSRNKLLDSRRLHKSLTVQRSLRLCKEVSITYCMQSPKRMKKCSLKLSPGRHPFVASL